MKEITKQQTNDKSWFTSKWNKFNKWASKINGESVSQTARILTLRGLENLEIADNLKDSVNFQLQN